MESEERDKPTSVFARLGEVLAQLSATTLSTGAALTSTSVVAAASHASNSIEKSCFASLPCLEDLREEAYTLEEDLNSSSSNSSISTDRRRREASSLNTRIVQDASFFNLSAVQGMASMYHIVETGSFIWSGFPVDGLTNDPGETTMHFYDRMRVEQAKVWSDEKLSEGLGYARGEQYQDAIAAYTQALAQNALNVDAFIARGAARANLKQFDEALVDFDRALALDPQSAQAASFKERTRQKMTARSMTTNVNVSHGVEPWRSLSSNSRSSARTDHILSGLKTPTSTVEKDTRSSGGGGGSLESRRLRELLEKEEECVLKKRRRSGESSGKKKSSSSSSKKEKKKKSKKKKKKKKKKKAGSMSSSSKKKRRRRSSSLSSDEDASSDESSDDSSSSSSSSAEEIDDEGKGTTWTQPHPILERQKHRLWG